jgi:hypothetical protein
VSDPVSVVAERMVAWGIGLEGDRSEATALLDAVREAGWRIVRTSTCGCGQPDELHEPHMASYPEAERIVDEWKPEDRT